MEAGFLVDTTKASFKNVFAGTCDLELATVLGCRTCTWLQIGKLLNSKSNNGPTGQLF